jgi:hypothetical protein
MVQYAVQAVVHWSAHQRSLATISQLHWHCISTGNGIAWARPLLTSHGNPVPVCSIFRLCDPFLTDIWESRARLEYNTDV